MCYKEAGCCKTHFTCLKDDSINDDHDVGASDCISMGGGGAGGNGSMKPGGSVSSEAKEIIASYSMSIKSQCLRRRRSPSLSQEIVCDPPPPDVVEAIKMLWDRSGHPRFFFLSAAKVHDGSWDKCWNFNFFGIGNIFFVI